jgi:hypothetical protein
MRIACTKSSAARFFLTFAVSALISPLEVSSYYPQVRFNKSPFCENRISALRSSARAHVKHGIDPTSHDARSWPGPHLGMRNSGFHSFRIGRMGNFASSLGMSTDTDSNDTTNNNIQIKRPSQKKLITAEESVKAFNFLTTTSREIDHSRRRRTVRAIETASRRKAIPAKNAQALRDEELSSILEDIARISADPSLTEVERIKLIRTAMPAPLSPEGKRKNQKKKTVAVCVCVHIKIIHVDPHHVSPVSVLDPV